MVGHSAASGLARRKAHVRVSGDRALTHDPFAAMEEALRRKKTNVALLFAMLVDGAAPTAAPGSYTTVA
jgi:hypothetical protein